MLGSIVEIFQFISNKGILRGRKLKEPSLPFINFLKSILVSTDIIEGSIFVFVDLKQIDQFQCQFLDSLEKTHIGWSEQS